MIRLVQDVLTGEWVSMNGERQGRPVMQNQSACPFCPGPLSEVGEYPFDVAVFENKFPSFHSPGHAEVVVYSPQHTDDLGYIPAGRAGLVWQVWADRVDNLGRERDTRAILVFENRGSKVGATIAHPHGQIYAYPYLPPRLVRELPHFAGSCPLCKNTGADLTLFEGRHWVLRVPSALRMPYETRLVPQRHVGMLTMLTGDEREEGAWLMQAMLRAYDRFFGMRTALVMALYQAPDTGGRYHMRWQFMPVDRGAGKIKYLAGSELAMGAFVVDMLPEQVAERLRPVLLRAMREGGEKAEGVFHE